LALTELVHSIEGKGEEEVKCYQLGEKTARVEVGEDHFFMALKSLTPSVSPEELERYNNLQKTYHSHSGHA
jgi:SpoVK/Ycf46/Vps4 family AAA+-type ATPase